MRRLIGRKTVPEKLLHTIYAQVVILTSHLEMADEVYPDLGDTKDNHLYRSIEKLRTIACKLYDFTLAIGVRVIKQKVCKLTRSVKVIKRDETNCTNYVISVLMHSETNIVDVIKTLDTIAQETEKCDLVGCENNNRNLNCRKKSDKSRKSARSHGRKCKPRRNGKRRNRKCVKRRKHRKSQRKSKGNTSTILNSTSRDRKSRNRKSRNRKSRNRKSRNNTSRKRT